MPVVQNVVSRPGGGVAAGVRVRVRLIASDPPGAPGFATDRTVIGEWFTLTDSAGAWSLTLTANALVTPAATVYEVAELAGPNAATYYVSVPNGAGPYWVGAILATAPGSLDTARATVRQGPESLWVYTGQAAPWPRSVANGLDEQLDIRPTSDGVVWDPLAMIQTGSYVSDTFGETWTAGSWLRLPVGIWALSLAVKWDGNTTGDREASLGVMDDRQLISDIDPFWWAPNNVENIASYALRVPAASLSAGFQVGFSITAVTPEMVAAQDGKSSAGQGVAVGFNTFQNSGATRSITYVTVGAVKIGANPVSA